MRVSLSWALQGGTAVRRTEVAIIADVLRASTVIVAALERGAKVVKPTSSIAHALELGKQHDTLLIGERQCQKVDGFDFGNSPTEIWRADLSGRALIFTSTNFPRAYESAREASVRVVGALTNLTAVTKYAYEVARKRGLDIRLVLAGNDGTDSEEDIAFAGASAMMLDDLQVEATEEVVHATESVRSTGAVKLARNSLHARELVALGFEEDVGFACQQDVVSVVPVGTENGIVSHAERSARYELKQQNES